MLHWPPCIALPITVFFFTIRENVMRDAWKQNRVGGFTSQTQHNEEKPVKRSRLCSETRSRLKVRPGRCALEGTLPEAPGPGGSLPKSPPVPESPLETRRRYGRRARKRRTWRNPALPGAGRLSVAATMRSWRRFRRRCGRTCRCRPSRWSRGGSCPSCGLRPRPQRRARGSARPPRRALRRRR